ncbi:bone morphogenetic protein 7-like [Centruroides vittatus]|uniref:bone morphogenetic protein 7-like n=1 Tax=Centruroides vittatus TaxID=120091 RepID=UPI00350FBF09
MRVKSVPNKMASRLVKWTVIVQCLYVVASQIYIDNGIDQTVVFRQLRVKEEDEMQQELLHLLGLDHPPQPKDHTIQRSAPQYLLDLYRTFVDFETGDIKMDPNNSTLGRDSIRAINMSDVIMSFVNRIDHHAPHLRHDRDRRFWFDVTDVKADEEIMAAEFRLYRDLTSSELPLNSTYTLTLYLLTDEPEDKGLKYIETITVQANQEGWMSFNVTEAIVTWIAFPAKNLGLYLQIRMEGLSRNVDPGEIGIVGRKGANERQPFMVAFLQSPRDLHVRHTRSTSKKKVNFDRTSYDYDKNWLTIKNRRDVIKKSCQRLAFYVSFQQLKWQEWIIAPDGYAAFYCYGECSFPLNAHMNATNHAIVQTLVHLMNPNDVPKPSCAPTHLSAVQVLYFDDNSNVVLKKYRNMVVQSCGCH